MSNENDDKQRKFLLLWSDSIPTLSSTILHNVLKLVKVSFSKVDVFRQFTHIIRAARRFFAFETEQIDQRQRFREFLVDRHLKRFGFCFLVLNFRSVRTYDNVFYLNTRLHQKRFQTHSKWIMWNSYRIEFRRNFIENRNENEPAITTIGVE